MSDPAVEAATRAVGEGVGFDWVARKLALDAAREALNPIRELIEGMREMFGDDVEIHVDELAELIYP